MSKERRLRKWYKYIGTYKFECKKGCSECCGRHIPISQLEHQWIGDVRTYNHEKKCKYWNDGCTIYEKRPLICRLFGLGNWSKGIICPYVKVNKFIPDAQVILHMYVNTMFTQEEMVEMKRLVNNGFRGSE